MEREIVIKIRETGTDGKLIRFESELYLGESLLSKGSGNSIVESVKSAVSSLVVKYLSYAMNGGAVLDEDMRKIEDLLLNEIFVKDGLGKTH